MPEFDSLGARQEPPEEKEDSIYFIHEPSRMA